MPCGQQCLLQLSLDCFKTCGVSPWQPAAGAAMVRAVSQGPAGSHRQPHTTCKAGMGCCRSRVNMAKLLDEASLHAFSHFPDSAAVVIEVWLPLSACTAMEPP